MGYDLPLLPDRMPFLKCCEVFIKMAISLEVNPDTWVNTMIPAHEKVV